MDWQTLIISLLGSGAVATLISGLMNHITKIKAIKESGLYTRRVDVLDKLAKLLEEVDAQAGSLISFFQKDGSRDAELKRRKSSAESFNNFVKYFQSHKHYLPKKISDQINNLSKKYKNIFIRFNYEARPIDDQQNTKVWQELIDFKKEVEKNKENIIHEFRKIIGVK